jgi:hypothetical protein
MGHPLRSLDLLPTPHRGRELPEFQFTVIPHWQNKIGKCFVYHAYNIVHAFWILTNPSLNFALALTESLEQVCHHSKPHLYDGENNKTYFVKSL